MHSTQAAQVMLKIRLGMLGKAMSAPPNIGLDLDSAMLFRGGKKSGGRAGVLSPVLSLIFVH